MSLTLKKNINALKKLKQIKDNVKTYAYNYSKLQSWITTFYNSAESNVHIQEIKSGYYDSVIQSLKTQIAYLENELITSIVPGMKQTISARITSYKQLIQSAIDNKQIDLLNQLNELKSTANANIQSVESMIQSTLMVKYSELYAKVMNEITILSSETFTINMSVLINSINQIILEVGNEPTGLSCPSGTMNDMNVQCVPELNYDGTYGNTTTAGYYATYNVSLNTIQELLNLQIVSNGTDITVGVEDNDIQMSGSAQYLSSITATGQAGGQCEVYIPQSQTCATACGCDTTCNSPCWSSCACGLTTKSCCCTTTCTTWPSTYSNDLLIGMATGVDVSVNQCSMNFTQAFTCSIEAPNNGLTVKEVYIPTDIGPVPLYFWNLVMSNMSINFGSASAFVEILGYSITVPSSTISYFINMIVPGFQDNLNATFDNYVFKIVGTNTYSKSDLQSKLQSIYDEYLSIFETDKTQVETVLAQKKQVLMQSINAAYATIVERYTSFKTDISNIKALDKLNIDEIVSADKAVLNGKMSSINSTLTKLEAYGYDISEIRTSLQTLKSTIQSIKSAAATEKETIESEKSSDKTELDIKISELQLKILDFTPTKEQEVEIREAKKKLNEELTKLETSETETFSNAADGLNIVMNPRSTSKMRRTILSSIIQMY